VNPSNKGKGGRPTILTADLTKRVVSKIRAGAYPYQAAIGAGVSSDSYYTWMRKGKIEAEAAETEGRESNVHGQFYTAVTRARALARIACEIIVKKDNPLAWLMKGPGRERPGEPGWSDKVEVTGSNAGPVKHQEMSFDTSKLSSEDLDALEALLSRAVTSATAE
jgi:hypothetical protein